MERVVETASGKLRGAERDGIFVFRGVPYARPPLGERRFRAPQPPEPWPGERDATRSGAAAPQNPLVTAVFPDLGVGRQQEDCLTLNVWTPDTGGPPRPVLVWIHGGAFVIGSGAQPIYDGGELARRGNVVVVTLNYRLGALGFLHLAEHDGACFGAASNAGLLDQIIALRWVRENAVAFGGDPEQITVFGESAGGMSVGTLLGTPEARGLFRRAVAQSGACQAIHTRESAAHVADALLQELALGQNEAAKLREVPVAALLAAQARVLARLGPRANLLTFQPVVDGRTLPRHPLEAVADGAAPEVALLAGTTRDEWRLFGLLDSKARGLDEAGLVARVERRVPGADARRLLALYREERAAGDRSDPASLLFALETDRVFRIPALRLAEAQLAQGAPTWVYRFDWEVAALGGVLGACHAVELPFVFGTLGLKGIGPLLGDGPEARRLAGRTMDAWLAFAHTGEPGHEALPAWPRYDLERRATLLFGSECRCADDPGGALRRAWDAIR